GHDEPGDHGDQNRHDAYDRFRQFAGREYRREAPDQEGQAESEEEDKQTDRADDRVTLQQLSRSRQQRGHQFVAPQHSALVLSHFVELASFRGHGDTVALEVDVNALRAIGRTLARGFASRTERAAALDA